MPEIATPGTSDEDNRPSRRDVFLAYATLPHAVPIVVVLLATIAFALIAASGWPGFTTMLRLLGAMLGAQLVIGVVNELVDIDTDALSKPDKPIPAGLVSRRGANSMLGSGLVLMAALGLSFGIASFAILAAGCGIGVAYSVWFKQTVWSWVPYLLALPLLPIWVWITLDTLDPRLFAIYPIGAGAMIAVQIAQSLPDVAADRAAGVQTLAARVGSRAAMQICWAALGAAAVLAAILAPFLTDGAISVWVAVIGIAVLGGVNAVIMHRDRRRGELASFPCVATGAALLGIAWAAALALG